MTIALRVVLGLVGLGVIALGLNMGLGGFKTLGLQGPTDFVAPVDPTAYAVQDNHVRFVSGFFFAGGLVLIAGSILLQRLATPVITVCVMIAIGGPFRLTGEGAAEALTSGALPSLVLELTLFPLLAFFVYRSTR